MSCRELVAKDVSMKPNISCFQSRPFGFLKVSAPAISARLSGP